MLNQLFEMELIICIKMDLALNNLQSLISHKANQPTNQLTSFILHAENYYGTLNLQSRK